MCICCDQIILIIGLGVFISLGQGFLLFEYTKNSTTPEKMKPYAKMHAVKESLKHIYVPV